MRIGIIGCGQLARMMVLAGIPLGLKFSFVADGGPNTDLSCVDGLGHVVHWQPGDSVSELYQQLGEPDVITVEKEQVDLQLVEQLALFCCIRPSVESIAQCKSRINEKQLLADLGIPSAPYTHNTTLTDSAETLGYPMVIKSLDEGYDGKNQWVVRNYDDLAALMEAQKANSALAKNNILAEQWIPFDCEVSLIAVRGTNGDIGFYPLTENEHSQGILVRSMAPAKHVTTEMEHRAQAYMRKILEAQQYVGVLAMELFVVGEQLLVNELAPRVHNSGHWTQLGAVTCQFENHLRAVAGLSLGATSVLGQTGMLNLLGVSEPPMLALSANASLHWYNKQAKPNRKLGHINFRGDDHTQLASQMQSVEQSLVKC